EPVEGSLTDTEWMKIWGKLSSMLHMRNPWLPERDIKRNHQFAKTVVDKLVTILNAHVTELVGGQHFVMAQVYASPVRAYGFSLVHNSDTCLKLLSSFGVFSSFVLQPVRYIIFCYPKTLHHAN